MTEPEETDAEVVERMRQNMQHATDEAIKAFDAGNSLEQFSDDYGLPTEHRQVMMADLRLLGVFMLDFHKPAPTMMRTMWVFVHEKENAHYVVGIENVARLDRLGVATLRAFVDAGDAS